MPFREGKLQILYLLLVQLATWSFSTSLPEKTAQLSPWNWDEDEFWYRLTTTRKPYIWDRRDDYGFNPSSSYIFPIIWIIVVAIFFLIVFIFFVRKICNPESSTNESPVTLHPPPATILPPRNIPAQNTTFSTIPAGAQYNFTAWSSPGVPSTQNAVDKPPGYSEVVLSDLTEGSAKFPDVCQQPNEIPPPKYGNENLMRF